MNYPKSCSTSTFQESENNEVSLWPNPSSDLIQFNILGLREIYDLTGKLVLSTNNKSVDIKSLNSGVYFVKFENSTIIKRFIKK